MPRTYVQVISSCIACQELSVPVEQESSTRDALQNMARPLVPSRCMPSTELRALPHQAAACFTYYSEPPWDTVLALLQTCWSQKLSATARLDVRDAGCKLQKIRIVLRS
jgi:hypothetical protein